MTYIATHPGASNREIAIGAGAIDEGQLSKLLGRAEFLGLVADRRSPDRPGAPRQWHLTEQGKLACAEAQTLTKSWSVDSGARDVVGAAGET